MGPINLACLLHGHQRFSMTNWRRKLLGKEAQAPGKHFSWAPLLSPPPPHLSSERQCTLKGRPVGPAVRVLMTDQPAPQAELEGRSQLPYVRSNLQGAVCLQRKTISSPRRAPDVPSNRLYLSPPRGLLAQGARTFSSFPGACPVRTAVGCASPRSAFSEYQVFSKKYSTLPRVVLLDNTALALT